MYPITLSIQSCKNPKRIYFSKLVQFLQVYQSVLELYQKLIRNTVSVNLYSSHEFARGNEHPLKIIPIRNSQCIINIVFSDNLWSCYFVYTPCVIRKVFRGICQ